MGKNEKVILFRIVLTGFLLLVAIFTDIFKLFEIPAHILIFLIIAYDIIWKADYEIGRASCRERV